MTFREFGTAVRTLWRNGPSGNLVLVDQTRSTNVLGRAYAERFFEDSDVPPTSFVIAREQTAGKGREAGRSWESHPGRGAYITLVHCLGEKPEVEVLQSVPIVVGTALCETLQTFTPDCRLKWPNDLYVGHRKLGGILIETCTSEDAEVALVVGFGVNLEPPDDKSLADSATCLRESAGSKAPDLEELILSLCKGISEAIPKFGHLEQALEGYCRNSLHSEGDALACQLGERRIEGTFNGFDKNGCLRLRTETGEEVIAAGDVILNHPPLG